jgi:hypothetical protein
MAAPENFKKKIKHILSSDSRIDFLGENFDKIALSLSEEKAAGIYEWLGRVKEKNIRPILTGSNKKYKNWLAYQLLTFRYAFSIEKTEYRILLVKVKNSFYIEFHLGTHKYYDTVRKKLWVKEDIDLRSFKGEENLKKDKFKTFINPYTNKCNR